MTAIISGVRRAAHRELACMLPHEMAVPFTGRGRHTTTGRHFPASHDASTCQYRKTRQMDFIAGSAGGDATRLAPWPNAIFFPHGAGRPPSHELTPIYYYFDISM